MIAGPVFSMKVSPAGANSSKSQTQTQAVPPHEQAGTAWLTVQKLVQSFQGSPGAGQSQAKAGLPVRQAIGDGSDNLSQAGEVAGSLIDFKQIAMRSLGKANWQSLSASQKQDLTMTIEALVQNRYYPRWRKIFGRGEVTYVSQELKNGDILVTTNLRLGHKDEPLIWQLSGDGQKSKVISLAVNQNDLLTKLAGRIQAHQARDGYTAMIAWLKSKSKCDIADGDMSAPKSANSATIKTSSRSIDLTD